jgi:hypothetical protein
MTNRIRLLIGAVATPFLILGCSGTSNLASASQPAAPVTDTYSHTLSNSGSSSVLLTERIGSVPGVTTSATVTSVSCGGASGGAMCPPATDVTVGNLLNGGINVTLPRGGAVTFTITATSP